MRGGLVRARSIGTIRLVALLLALGLLAVAIKLAVADQAQRRDSLERALRAEAREQAAQLDEHLSQARSLTLVAANNPPFRNFYKLPGTRRERVLSGGRTLVQAQRALGYIATVFPGVAQASFIDRAGAENARAVRGTAVRAGELSPDRTGEPFFFPTLALKTGQVYQARPELSPQTSEWVVSNSTPVPAGGRRSPAILQFEIRMESIRTLIVDTRDRFDVAIVEASSGKVVADSRFPQAPGEQSKLGVPGDNRFAALFSAAGPPQGIGEAGGRPSGFSSVGRVRHNANKWVVVVTAREPVGGWMSGLGAPELAMLGLALLLIAFGVLSYRASQAELRSAALTDPLTGLRNRRCLLTDMERGLAQAGRDDSLLLGVFDLDGFKGYNDTFGHPAGDALLARLGAALQKAVRDHGTAYRMGGDEFCVLARVADRDADALLSAVHGALSEHGEGFTIAASYGSVLMPAEATDLPQALHIADQRMYARKNSRADGAGRQTTEVLTRVLAERLPHLGEHVDEVTRLCAQLAEALGLPDGEREPLLQAAALHDIGKAAVPDAILDKAEPLDEDEREFMRQHSLIGARILAAAPSLARAAVLVRAVQEHFDGSGYPDGLAGEEIPLGARIVAVCDAFDAMTTSRPYREAPMSPEGALAEIKGAGGTQFDPAVVAAFERTLAKQAAFARSA
jgi:diguanylate cyclase (GGDEF)-like protein